MLSACLFGAELSAGRLNLFAEVWVVLWDHTFHRQRHEFSEETVQGQDDDSDAADNSGLFHTYQPGMQLSDGTQLAPVLPLRAGESPCVLVSVSGRHHQQCSIAAPCPCMGLPCRDKFHRQCTRALHSQPCGSNTWLCEAIAGMPTSCP